MNALDLIGEKVSASDVVKAKEILQAAYGKELDIKKFAIFFEMIQEDNWSSKRLENAVKTLIKTNKWSNWTIADLYGIGPELHGYSWFLEQEPGSTDCYLIEGKAFWCKKEVNLYDFPYKKIDININKEHTNVE